MADQISEGKKAKKEYLRHVSRLLKLASSNRSRGIPYLFQNSKLCLKLGGRVHRFEAALVDELADEGLLVLTPDFLRITDSGIEKLEQIMGLTGGSVAKISSVDRKDTDRDKQSHLTSRQCFSESPLSRLYFRKDRNGVSYLTENEFHAGERLRTDFERGQLQPRITANYSQIGSNSGSYSGEADISDFAIDARRKVNQALHKLQPDLAGVVIDVCCFLKGLELVERERMWPARSAKLMLKTGLSILSTHYGFESGTRKTLDSVVSWTGDGYRPSIM